MSAATAGASGRAIPASRSAAFAQGSESVRLAGRRAVGAMQMRRAGRKEKAPAVFAAAAGTTPVKKTSMLVIGATGTLGRQVVKRALDEGYDVRCLVRPRPIPADFLREWGATTVSGDLAEPEQLPAALVGVHTIVDCATSKPEEPLRAVDWDAKVKLIQAAKAMGIQRYIFFSVDKADKHPEVPLMNLKYCTEKYLEASGLNYTVMRLSGFMQPLISQYAVPILDEQSVWGTSDSTRIAYMDTQDVAKMTMKALNTDATIGKTLTLAGPKSYTVQEIIALCEKYADSEAKVVNVPVFALKATRALTSFFQWSRDVADRLAFAEVLSSKDSYDVKEMEATYKLLGVEASEITTLETYLKEYFSRIISKLKEVSGESEGGSSFYL
eukprot:CAMPEP_0170132794 /NCGR_PEP_ID=MMETSP0033_2-20121228/820_1 /TAXON_ID=195969 /ORGANISM="Dolichomastix tenuilepis, Strain CCMP3274" /LENGTH=383 /DNA_ID=CAMNT_0010368227 /DNA_START=75 /DNA_END=1226 /DNA_ORIENTATION=+